MDDLEVPLFQETTIYPRANSEPWWKCVNLANSIPSALNLIKSPLKKHEIIVESPLDQR